MKKVEFERCSEVYRLFANFKFVQRVYLGEGRSVGIGEGQRKKKKDGMGSGGKEVERRVDVVEFE